MSRRNVRVGFKRPPLILLMFHMAVFALVGVLWAAAVACFLQAINRIARAQELAARARALDALGTEISDEDRRSVVESMRGRALKRL
jgi:hypothetical protein